MSDDELLETTKSIRDYLRSETDWQKRARLAAALVFCSPLGIQRHRERQESLLL